MDDTEEIKIEVQAQENKKSEDLTPQDDIVSAPLTNNQGPPVVDEVLPTDEYEKEIKSLQKKISPIQKILIGVVAFLLLVILVFTGLYFIGFFEPAVKVDEHNKTKKPTQHHEQNVTKKPQYKFDIEHINTDRINKKLSLLTRNSLSPQDLNTSMHGDNNLSMYDRETLELTGKEKYLAEANISNVSHENTSGSKNSTKEFNLEKNTSIKNHSKEVSKITSVQHINKVNTKEVKTSVKIAKEVKKKTESVVVHTQQKQVKSNTKLKYIQVVTLKYEMYKTFLDKVKEVDARISVCKDSQNRTQVFIGPFNDDKNRKAIIKQINSSLVKDSFGVEFTKDEFEKKCGI